MRPVHAVLLLMLLLAGFLTFRILGPSGLGAPLLYDRKTVIDAPIWSQVLETTASFDGAEHVVQDAEARTYTLGGCVVADIGDVRIAAIGTSGTGTTGGSVRIRNDTPREHLEPKSPETGAGTGARAFYVHREYETSHIRFGDLRMTARDGAIQIGDASFPVGEGKTVVFVDEFGVIQEVVGEIRPTAPAPTPSPPDAAPAPPGEG